MTDGRMDGFTHNQSQARPDSHTIRLTDNQTYARPDSSTTRLKHDQTQALPDTHGHTHTTRLTQDTYAILIPTNYISLHLC